VNTVQLSTEEYQLISGLIYQNFGINLSEQKRTLITERLQKILLAGGFTSFQEYYNYVVHEPSGRALLAMVDRISTNHTIFFREKEHFDILAAIVLPQVKKRLHTQERRDIRIWSAGCSSGEEPYSLAMVLAEYFGSETARYDIGILATDIAISALDKAARGAYSTNQIASIPPLYKQRYFVPSENKNWMVKDNLQKMITFRRLNLMRQTYPFRGKFQVIFCRNVMIYFDKVTRDALLERLHQYLEPEGYLFIGHSESISSSAGLYRFIKPAVYQRI